MLFSILDTHYLNQICMRDPLSHKFTGSYKEQR